MALWGILSRSQGSKLPKLVSAKERAAAEEEAEAKAEQEARQEKRRALTSECYDYEIKLTQLVNALDDARHGPSRSAWRLQRLHFNSWNSSRTRSWLHGEITVRELEQLEKTLSELKDEWEFSQKEATAEAARALRRLRKEAAARKAAVETWLEGLPEGEVSAVTQDLTRLNETVTTIRAWNSLAANKLNLEKLERKVEKLERQVQDACQSPRFKQEAFRGLAQAAFTELVPETHRNSAIKLLENALTHKSLVYHPEFRTDSYALSALEIKPDSGLYLIPTLALTLKTWQGAHESVDASDLDDATLETIAVLYKGAAYETLAEARDASLALT